MGQKAVSDEGNGAAVVQERLRILSDCIEAMRAAVPCRMGRAADEIVRTIHKAHDQLVTEFIVWIQRWVTPLDLDIPEEHYRPPGCVTLVCRWKPQGEKQ